MSSGQNMFTKGQSGELAWVTSSSIPSPLKWFLGPFSDFTSSLYNKLKCCEFKGKQASTIKSTSLCCRSYSVLHVRDQENEWSVFVE